MSEHTNVDLRFFSEVIPDYGQRLQAAGLPLPSYSRFYSILLPRSVKVGKRRGITPDKEREVRKILGLPE